MQSLYVISEELAGQTESALANLAKHTLCVFRVSKSLFHVWGFFFFLFLLRAIYLTTGRPHLTK